MGVIIAKARSIIGVAGLEHSGKTCGFLFAAPNRAGLFKAPALTDLSPAQRSVHARVQKAISYQYFLSIINYQFNSRHLEVWISGPKAPGPLL